MDKMKLQTGKSRIEVENPDEPLRKEIIDRLGAEVAKQIHDFVASKGAWAFEEAKRTGKPVTITMEPPSITITPASSKDATNGQLLISSSS